MLRRLVCAAIIPIIAFALFAASFGAIKNVISGAGNMPASTRPATGQAAMASPKYSDDAGNGYGSCYRPEPLYVFSGGDTTVTLRMYDSGDVNCAFIISVIYEDGLDWVQTNPGNGLIPAGFNYDVRLKFSAPAGAVPGSQWKCTIRVDHNAPGSPRLIPVCLDIGIADSWNTGAVLATACKRLYVRDDGLLANNQRDAALDMIDDCDTFNTQTNSHIYLHIGTPIVSWITGAGDTVRYCEYDESVNSPKAFATLKNIRVDSTIMPSYTYATSTFCTADSSIGFVAHYWFPRASDTCDIIFCKLKFVNRTATTINGVKVGELLDWDVPSDSGVRNGSGFSAPYRMIYQYGVEFNQDDSTEALCPQQSSLRYAALANTDTITFFKNYLTFDAPTYIYKSGPYHDSAPLPAGAVYRLMTIDGYQRYMPYNPESLYVDLVTLVTFGSYNLAPGDTNKAVFILATTKTGFARQFATAGVADQTDEAGLAGLNEAITKARIFSENHPETRISCCQKAGDANVDSKLNVGDAVFVINYVFKSGPRPVCMHQADTNGDCKVNVGDIVYIINHVFKGFAPPACGPDECIYH
jgi:hypothetical protein